MIAILAVLTWNLSVDLICINLMTKMSDIFHVKRKKVKCIQSTKFDIPLRLATKEDYT
jgi:hypothetical protein